MQKMPQRTFDRVFAMLETTAVNGEREALFRPLSEEAMTNPDLIERLGKATGPDRELFELVFFAAFGRVTRGDNDAMARWLWFSRLLDAGAWVDAALMLVPEGHRYLIDKRPGAHQRPDGYRAEVYYEGHYYKSDRSDVPAAWTNSAALSICIAALKARAAIAGEQK